MVLVFLPAMFHNVPVTSLIDSFQISVFIFTFLSITILGAESSHLDSCFCALDCFEDECNSNRLERCNSNNTEHCKDNEHSCYTSFIVNPDTGRRHITLASCYDQSCRKRQCFCYPYNGKEECHCCCPGNMCNKNIDRLLSITAASSFGKTPSTTASPSLHVSLSTTALPLSSSQVTSTSIPVTTTLPSTSLSSLPSTLDSIVRHIVNVVGTAVGSVVFAAVVFVVCYYWCSRRRHLENPKSGVRMSDIENQVDSDVRISNLDLTTVWKECRVAVGRFANVWKVRLDENVYAAKVFSREGKKWWNAEVEGYEKPCISHENVLKFVTAGEMEKEEGSGLMEYWILTEFHEMGSLMDYLKNATVTFHELCGLSQSVARGLAYLHAELLLPCGAVKPVIAHRDVKSKNVLVKSKTVCCISDLGLAMKFQPGTALVEAQGQVGTIPYMAPEVLEGAIDFHRESFLRIDIYAMALVLWEILSRCNAGNGIVHDYRKPFEKEVGSHLSFEQMKDCVVKQRLRPEFPKYQDSLLPFDAFEEMIEECWDSQAEARLTAHCVDERISQLEISEKSIESSGYDSLKSNEGSPSVFDPTIGSLNKTTTNQLLTWKSNR